MQPYVKCFSVLTQTSHGKVTALEKREIKKGLFYVQWPKSNQPFQILIVEFSNDYMALKSVFPTLCNQIWPITLKIMAIMAKKFLKYGHNMATFSMDFDPIFSFYCIFMWQFLQKISNWKRNFSNFFWEKFPKCKSENSKMKIIGKICFLPQNFVNVKLKSEIWPKWPQN